MNGTYDNTRSGCREVWIFGLLAVQIPACMLDELRDGHTGQKVSFEPWGTFPDMPTLQ